MQTKLVSALKGIFPPRVWMGVA